MKKNAKTSFLILAPVLSHGDFDGFYAALSIFGEHHLWTSARFERKDFLALAR